MNTFVGLKRRQPFDDFVPQSKLFVTEKVACSKLTAQTTQMKAVQDKTLLKLFKGANAKKLAQADTEAQCVHFSERLRLEEASQKYRQMHINNQGKLIAPESDPVNETSGVIIITNSMEVSKCSYCEVVIKCQQCLQECQKCRNVFCPRCCLVMSHNMQDVTVCLSCMT